MNVKTLNALPKAEIRYIEPMYARLVNELPEGKEWLYESMATAVLPGEIPPESPFGRGEETFSQTSSRTLPKRVNGCHRALY
jgi:hypothetical protein